MKLKQLLSLIAFTLASSLVASAGEMTLSPSMTAHSAAVLSSVKLFPPLPNPNSPYPPARAEGYPPLPNPNSPYPPARAEVYPPLPNPNSPYPPARAEAYPPLPNPNSPYPPLG
ncbi:MAG: hypothetical protein JO033_24110 [Acidobacteriaceae bacterium]|nr:hypothetical protein [Acidobacteriaceae bacterium]MBV9497956.1 hypothetical protein [Acidobacteriaceae bacterium]